METQEQEETRSASTEKAMRDAGVATETEIYVDYFDFDDTRRVILPDGKQYVEIQVLNEGARRKYLNATNKEVTIGRATGDAKMKIASGDDRHMLLESAIVDWSLWTRNAKTGEMEQIKYNDQNLRRFLEKASPTVIDLIEKEVRKDNPWLVADVSVEDIDNQIKELQELKEQKLREAEGNDS